MKLIKTLVRNAFHTLGFEVSRYSPLGQNWFTDIKKLICDSQRTIIFDVGANRGRYVTRFKDIIPQCEIHAFEPGPETYKSLVRNINTCSDVYPNNLAVGSSCEKKHFLEYSDNSMSSFLKPGSFCWGEITRETPVEVTTLDRYCHENDIPYITLLKTDTQGYDFEVLKGAKALMESNRMQMVLMEVIFSDMYQNLPSFDEIFRFLLDRNFKLVSFYRFYHQHNIASWSDALFLNPKFSLS